MGHNMKSKYKPSKLSRALSCNRKSSKPSLLGEPLDIEKYIKSIGKGVHCPDTDMSFIFEENSETEYEQGVDIHVILGVDKNNNFHAAYFEEPIEDLNVVIDFMEGNEDKSRFMVLPFTEKMHNKFQSKGLELSKGIIFISGKTRLPFVDRRRYSILLGGDENLPSVGDYVLFQEENTLLFGTLVNKEKVFNKTYGVVSTFSTLDKAKESYTLPIETIIKAKTVINDDLKSDAKVSPELIAKVMKNIDTTTFESMARLFGSNTTTWLSIVSEMRKMV